MKWQQFLSLMIAIQVTSGCDDPISVSEDASAIPKTPQTMVQLCPNVLDGDHASGDHDFDGLVNIFGTITLRHDEQSVIADFDLNFEEKNGRKDTKIHYKRSINTDVFADPGTKIKGFLLVSEDLDDEDPPIIKKTLTTHILAGDFGGGGYETGNCHDGEIHRYPTDKLSGDVVGELYLIADTGDQDVSSDRDCKCDSRIERIEFKRFKIVVDTN